MFKGEIVDFFSIGKKWRSREEEPPPKDESFIDGFFDRHFELLDIHDPERLRSELLGGVLASGLLARESDAIAKIEKAADIAAKAHKNQPRKLSSDPYVVHPYRSAHLAMELAEVMGVEITSELIVGALLHDTVEDNEEVTQEYLMDEFSEFGPDYAACVAQDAEALSKYTKGAKLHAKGYSIKIKANTDETSLVRRLIIKTADRVDNLLDPPRSPESKDPKDILREKRNSVITSTRNDLMPTLYADLPPKVSDRLDPLFEVLSKAMFLSQKTLDGKEFDPRRWKEYSRKSA